MSLTLGTNIASVSTQRYLNIASTRQSEEISKLSSGTKITKAADDAAGLAISTKLTIKVTSLNKAIDNGNQGVAMLQTAEGGLSTISDILTRLKELATEAASANNATDRGSLQLERAKLETQITNIAEGTKYGATSLLSGSAVTATGTEGSLITTANGINSITGTTEGVYAITSSGVDASGTVELTLTNADGIGQTVTVTVPTAGKTADIEFDQLGVTVEVNENLDTDADVFVAPAAAAAITGTSTASFGTMAGTLKITDTTNSVDYNIDLSNVDSITDLAAAIENTATLTTDLSATVAGGKLVLTSAANHYTVDISGITEGNIGATANFSFVDTVATTMANAPTFGDMAGTLNINGTSIDVTGVNTLDGLVTAINAAAPSAVTASASNGALVLTPDSATDTMVVDDSGVTTGNIGWTTAQKQTAAYNAFAVTTTGSSTTTFTYQLGDTSASYNKVTATIGSVDLAGLGLTGLGAWADGDDGTAEEAYLDAINDAIDVVNDQRASIGSFQSQIEYQVSNLEITVENTESAVSTIKDTDYSASYSEYTKYNVMSQAGVAMLAQANQIPQQILTLLRG